MTLTEIVNLSCKPLEFKKQWAVDLKDYNLAKLNL